MPHDLGPGDECPKCPKGKIGDKPKWFPEGSNKRVIEKRHESGQLTREALEYSCTSCGWGFYLPCKPKAAEDQSQRL